MTITKPTNNQLSALAQAARFLYAQQRDMRNWGQTAMSTEPRRCQCGREIPPHVRPDEVGGSLCSRCYNGILGIVGDGQDIDGNRDRVAGQSEAEQARRGRQS